MTFKVSHDKTQGKELKQGVRDHRSDTMKNLGVKEIHVFIMFVQQSYIHIYRETELDSVSISLGWLSYYL
jgi:hypothetical protein